MLPIGNSIQTKGVWQFEDGVEMDWMQMLVLYGGSIELGLLLNTFNTDHYTGFWHDAELTTPFYFICEKNK